MSTQEPGRAPTPPPLTALPRIEDLPERDGAYDATRVRESFEAFRRHIAQLQAQLRVLQAAGRGAHVEPTGHSVRMDALHLIRAAAEFADTLERDAQKASAAQLARTEVEVRRRQRELTERDEELERFRTESERERAEILNAARAEAREITAAAERQANQEIREAEARAARLLEQSRHQATELTNAARAEVEQTLEWARTQAQTVISRAQEGAEQLLRAAGLGEPALNEVTQAILRAAERVGEPAPGTEPAERPEPPRLTPPAAPGAGEEAREAATPPPPPGPTGGRTRARSAATPPPPPSANQEGEGGDRTS